MTGSAVANSVSRGSGPNSPGESHDPLPHHLLPALAPAPVRVPFPARVPSLRGTRPGAGRGRGAGLGVAMKRAPVLHLVSPFDCIGKRVPPNDRAWTWCGRLLYHVTPRSLGAPVCKVCWQARASKGEGP